MGLDKYLLSANKKYFYEAWFRLGATQAADTFAPIMKMQGGKDVVDRFTAAYKMNMIKGTSDTTATNDFYQYVKKMEEKIEKLPRSSTEYKRCSNEVYARIIAVDFRDQMGKDTLDTIIESVRSLRELPKDFISYMKVARKLQLASAKKIMKMGFDGKYYNEFINSYMTFLSRVPPNDAALLEIFDHIHKCALDMGTALISNRRQAYGGFLNKIQGSLFEVFISRSEAWLTEVEKRMKEARGIAGKLNQSGAEGRWKAKRIVGNMTFYGQETWDEAIIIFNDEIKQAFVYSAAQFKAERALKALKQIPNDKSREINTIKTAMEKITKKNDPEKTGMPNMLEIRSKGEEIKVYNLCPALGENEQAYRYIANTAEAKIYDTHIKELRQAGIVVDRLESGISAREMRSIADAYARSVLSVLGLI